MKVVFISCYLSPHQKPFCDKMYSILKDEFIFIATEPINTTRLALGWSCENPSYCLLTYTDEENQARAYMLANEADVVILGGESDKYIINRLKKGKLTFKYNERFYKTGLGLRTMPRAMVGAWLHHGRFQHYPLFMLCASAYTAGDAAVFNNYINKTYKWGYFPEVKQYDVTDLMSRKLSAKLEKENKKPKASILWAGRLIQWKHPELSIELAKSLKEKGYSFRISIIGNGEMEEQLHAEIIKNNLEDCIEMLGAMSPEKVRMYMEEADIYLFTSDFNEGWGAVLNESMNSGCAVVASHAIGSVPFLIKDGINGLIYENGNTKALENRVIELLDSSDFRRKIGANAYTTIEKVWNADVAANRFILLAQSLLKKEGLDDLFYDGPCSKAKIITNEWYQRQRMED